MRTSKSYWFVMGMLCLVFWPAVIAAHVDWRVAQAQEQLKAAGYDPGPIDGILGPLTRMALRRYQDSQKLPQTGVLDEVTRQVLLSGERTQTDREGQPEPGLKSPPGGEYKKISELFQMHDFFPGLGILYVDPATVPVGPYLAYDQQGNLVSTVYMVPLKDLRAGKAFNNLVVAHAKVDHVDVYYTNGHPGVSDPHYHVVLWYISAKRAAALQ